MKLNRKALRRLILEEMNTLNEECPTGLPCPIAAAAELKAAGAGPDELLDWVAKLLQELLSPVERDLDSGDLTGSEEEVLPATVDPGSPLMLNGEF